MVKRHLTSRFHNYIINDFYAKICNQFSTQVAGPLKNGHERSNIIPVLALSPLLGKVGWKLTCAPKGSIVDNESRGFAIMHHSKTDVSNEKFTIQNVFSCHVKRSLIMIDFLQSYTLCITPKNGAH